VQIAARLDRLPWSGWHWRVVTALGVTWMLDGLEVTVVGSLGGVLQEEDTLHLTARAVGLSATAYLAGAVLGSLLFGWLTDRLGRIGRASFTVAHFAHRTARTPQSSCDLAQAAPFRQPSSDLLVPMHRHAPKRHAAVSFVVAHEGCGSGGQESGDEGSGARNPRFDCRGQKLGRLGSP